jgi:hypothetical protein
MRENVIVPTLPKFSRLVAVFGQRSDLGGKTTGVEEFDYPFARSMSPWSRAQSLQPLADLGGRFKS